MGKFGTCGGALGVYKEFSIWRGRRRRDPTCA